MAGIAKLSEHDSVVSKLCARETRGNLQSSFRRKRIRWFRKCPQRFCIPLASILDVNGVLRRGHVILGFTKGGRHLISYRLEISTDNNCLMPHYSYSLHWWEFDQNNPLVEVHSVSLFGEEEIHEDLRLLVCEIQDETKVVVYGEILTLNEDQTRQCYVTICAAPRPRRCPDCRGVASAGVVQRCPRHSYAIHFKYDLMPPCPLFNPSTSLSIHNAVIINTGDFLMALKVSVSSSETTSVQDFLKLSFPSETESTRTPQELDECSCRGETNSSSMKDGRKIRMEEQSGMENQIGMEHENGLKDQIGMEDQIGMQDQIGMEDQIGMQDQIEMEDQIGMQDQIGIENQIGWTAEFQQVNVTGTQGTSERRKLVSGFVNALNEIHGLKTAGDRSLPLNVTAAVTETSTSERYFRCENASQFERAESYGVGHPGHQGAQTLNLDFLREQCVKKTRVSQKDGGGLNCSERRQNESCSFSNSEVINQSHDGDRETHDSTCHCESVSHSALNKNSESDSGDRETRDSTCHCGSMSHSAPNKNSLSSFVCKVYAEADDADDVLTSDDFDMYDGSIPLAVQTCHGKTLRQLYRLSNNNNNNNNPAPCSSEPRRNAAMLLVAQVTLDLEQCMSQWILAHDGLRLNYKSLKDYDVQLVGVCPDTEEVVAMARMLVYTRTVRRSLACGLPISPSPALQCAGFLFSWNIQTGAVKVLQVFELEDYMERSHSGFNMAAKEASDLRTKFSTPQSFSSAVQSFSNHNVFTGKSLKYIRHPLLPLVIVL